MFKDPQIFISKSNRTLELLDGDRPVKRYRIVLGSSPKGNKETEGDGRTPEGTFYVFTKNAESKYHLSLGISYPDAAAAKRGVEEGLITIEERDAIVQAIDEKRRPPQKTLLGGDIYIHGGGIESDWTEGCVALDDEAMDELFAAVPVGCPVTIVA